MNRLRWEHLAFGAIFVLVCLLDAGAIHDARWRVAADHLVALAGLAGIYVGRPLRRSAQPGEFVLPDPRPGAAGGPLLALVCLGALFAGGCQREGIDLRTVICLGIGFVLSAGLARLIDGAWPRPVGWCLTVIMSLGLLAIGGPTLLMAVSSAVILLAAAIDWTNGRRRLAGSRAFFAVVLIIGATMGGCTVAERARIRDGLITTSIGAVNCAAPGLQAGIQAAVVQLLGSAVSGRGAGTAQEWRALGLELAKTHGIPAAHCAAEVAAKELAKIALPPGPTVASVAPVVGFVQPQSGGTRAQASGGALGLEASAGGSSPGAGLPGSITVSEDDPAGRARAAAHWLRSHPGEW